MCKNFYKRYCNLRENAYNKDSYTETRKYYIKKGWKKHMTNNTITKELLNKNKKALQFAHIAYGFDFEKPFEIAAGAGAFTVNSLLKMVDDPVNKKIMVYIIPPETYREQDLHHIEINARGVLDLHYHEKLPTWEHHIDEFYAKSQFEDKRKTKQCKYYIISQHLEYIKPFTPEEFDSTKRYVPLPFHFTNDGHGGKYINSIDIKSRTGGNKRFTVKANEFYYSDHRERIRDINDIIDKSGYLLNKNRERLRNLAKMRRAKKAKAVVISTDYSATITRMKNDLDNARRGLITAAANAHSYKTLKDIETAFTKLKWLYFDFENVTNKLTQKTYSTPENAERAINSFFEGIKKLNALLSEEEKTNEKTA